MTQKKCKKYDGRGPSSRDRYGIKFMPVGGVRFVPGKTRDQFRRVLVSYCRRNPRLMRKVFEWSDDTGGLIVRRVI
jgi:hypothetical protein